MYMHLLKTTLASCYICLLTACATNYQFSPPNSATGQSCVAQCKGQESNCQQQEDSEMKACAESARQNYESCLRMFPLNPSYQCRQQSCTLRSYFSCSENYRSCYQQCGGKVDEVK